MKKHTITLTTKELETLIDHLRTDLDVYGVNGSWGDGEGWLNDKGGYTPNPNVRTIRGETIIYKLYNALNV